MDKYNALIKIRYYCSQSERSRQEVRQKLKTWQVAPTDTADIIAHLEAESFISEQRYLRSFIADKLVLQRWGKNKVRYALQAKGFNKADIDAEMEQQLELTPYKEHLHYFLSRKKQSLERQENLNVAQRKQKISLYLTQKGYEFDLVKAALEDEDFNA